MNNEHTPPTEEDKPRSSRRGGNLMSGLILIALGVLFLLNNFDMLDFGRYWPLLLIVIGIGLLLKRAL